MEPGQAAGDNNDVFFLEDDLLLVPHSVYTGTLCVSVLEGFLISSTLLSWRFGRLWSSVVSARLSQWGWQTVLVSEQGRQIAVASEQAR